MLKTLHDHCGRILSRDQLLSSVYADYRVVTDRTVDTYIKNLRRKLDQASPDHELLPSIYGLGYRLED